MVFGDSVHHQLMKHIGLASTLLMLLTSCPTPTMGQSQHAPFSHIFVEGGMQHPLHSPSLRPYWSQQFPTLHVGTGTPFYVGEITVEAGYSTFESDDPQIPDFKQLQLAAAWREMISIASRMKITGGVRLLSRSFSYKHTDQTVRPALGNDSGPESEVGLGLEAGLRWQPADRWALQGGLHREVVFTRHKIKTIVLTLSLRYALNSPSWFQTLFTDE